MCCFYVFDACNCKKSTNKKRSQQKLTKKIKFNKQKINSLIGQQQYKKEKKVGEEVSIENCGIRKLSSKNVFENY